MMTTTVQLTNPVDKDALLIPDGLSVGGQFRYDPLALRVVCRVVGLALQRVVHDRWSGEAVLRPHQEARPDVDVRLVLAFQSIQPRSPKLRNGHGMR